MFHLAWLNLYLYCLHSIQPGHVQDHDCNAWRILSVPAGWSWTKKKTKHWDATVLFSRPNPFHSNSLNCVSTLCSSTLNQLNQLLSPLHSHSAVIIHVAQQLLKLNQTVTRGTLQARWVSMSSRTCSQLWTAGSRTSWCLTRTGVEPLNLTRWLRQSTPWVRALPWWIFNVMVITTHLMIIRMFNDT